MNKALSVIAALLILGINSFAQTADNADKKVVENLTSNYSQFTNYWMNKPFTLKSFRTIDGKFYTPGNLKGKAVFYRFSYHYCSPCRAELPIFTQLSDLATDVLFVYVTYDDTATIRKSFEKTGGMHHVLVTQMTSEDISKGYYTLGYPSNFWVDKNGRVRNLKIGGRVNHVEETREEWLKQLSEIVSF